MRREQTEQNSNSGFSLVELIVSILIMSVVAGIVVILIASSRTAYSVVNTDSVIREEAETVRAFMNEIAIEAHSCSLSEENCGGDDKCFWILAPENHEVSGVVREDNNCYYFLLFENDTKCLRYGKYKATDYVDDVENEDYISILKTGATPIAGDKYSLLAQHVEDFTCEVNGNLITITLTISFNDSTVVKRMTFTGRNIKNT